MNIKKINFKKLFFRLCKFGFFSTLFGIISLFIALCIVSYSLPSPESLVFRKVEQSTKIYDKNGVLLYDVYGDKDRTIIKREDISQNVINALLSVEDDDFYTHKGINPVSIVRAALETARGNVQGASTITQQLTKNVFFNPGFSLLERGKRKVKEFILTLQLETKYTKDEIITFYLNEVNFGGPVYGIEAAADQYFNKEAKDLTVGEASYLAGLVQRPSAYSAFGKNKELGINRQKQVLELMKVNGWVTKNGERKFLSETEYTNAIKGNLTFGTGNQDIKAPHFVFYVIEELEEKYGKDLVQNGGLTVNTTIDINLVNQLQEIVRQEVANNAIYNVSNGALVAINPQNRQIIAMIGSKGYNEEGGKFNVTTSENRQPGSSIKPFVYAMAFEKGLAPGSRVFDVTTDFAPSNGGTSYVPENYTKLVYGNVSLRYALSNSLNIPAVKMLDYVGVNKFVDRMKDFGININKEGGVGLSASLGGKEVPPLNMANGFAVFASGGKYKEPIAITSLLDKNGDEIPLTFDTEEKQVMDKGIAYLITNVLSDNKSRIPAFGPDNLLQIDPHEVAVKTGTTNDIRDNWAIGYTNDVVIATWVGNNDNSPLYEGISSGITGATPMWNKAIKLFLNDSIPNKFIIPEDAVVKAEIGSYTGYKKADADIDAATFDYFIKDQEPQTKSEWIVRLEVCEDDNKLANDKCKSDNKTKYKDFIKVETLMPHWQPAVDAFINNYVDRDKDVNKSLFPPEDKSKYDGKSSDDDDDDDDDS